MNFVIIDRVYWSPIDTSSNNRTLPISDPPPLNHQYQNSGQSRQGLILSSICQAIVLAFNHLSFFHSSIKNPPQYITRYLCEGMSGARTQIFLCYWTIWRARDVFIIPGGRASVRGRLNLGRNLNSVQVLIPNYKMKIPCLFSTSS